MDAETVNKLLEINRAFYSEFSEEFSDSRSSDRFNIEPFRPYLANGIRLLDAGCGNGRLAETLERDGYAVDYLGIEQSPELIDDATHRCRRLNNVRAEFRIVNLAAPGWGEHVSDEPPFDVIVCLAVLHHIPSFALRASVLQQVQRLLKPNAVFVMTNWQFLNSERLRKKIVGWEALALGDGKMGVKASELEHGDYLMDWKRGGVGYRYVHLVDENEVHNLTRASGLQVVEQFYADNNLNLFSILQNSNL